jgi:CubicO group peptidase (beta-lactamase class C family)
MITRIAAIALALTAPAARADEIDDLVKAAMTAQKVPGLTLAVVKDGKVRKVQGYGLANVEHEVPAKRETVYQSGSVGKQITAALILLLAEDGKLGLDDPVSKHLPGAPQAWKGVTVRHLLTHTSGIGDYEQAPGFDLQKDFTDDQLLKLAFAVKPAAAPGARWAYSNTGYAVLGVLASKVGGKFYGDQLRDRVFTPLGMKTARIIDDAAIVPNRAAGYEFGVGGLRNQSWVSPTFNRTADGSLYVTIDDMIAWDAGLTAGKLLSKDSYAAMWTKVKTADGKEHDYGFGWQLGARNGHKRVHHGGAWQGFTTYIDRYPDDGLTVIVLCNLAPPFLSGVTPGGDPEKVASGVAALVVPELAATKKK